RRLADLEEIQLLRAPRCDRSAGDRLAAGDRVDQRTLAHVRAAREGDLGKVRLGQEVQRRRREQELDAPGEQPARLFDEVGIVRGHYRMTKGEELTLPPCSARPRATFQRRPSPPGP